MKLFTAAILLSFIGSIMGLKCYLCTYGSGTGTDSAACKDPFNASGDNVQSIDCSILGTSFDTCAKTVGTINGVDTAARTCFTSAGCPSQNGCASGGGATVCCCNSDNCNGASAIGAANIIVATVALVLSALMYTM